MYQFDSGSPEVTQFETESTKPFSALCQTVQNLHEKAIFAQFLLVFTIFEDHFASQLPSRNSKWTYWTLLFVWEYLQGKRLSEY